MNTSHLPEFTAAVLAYYAAAIAIGYLLGRMRNSRAENLRGEIARCDQEISAMERQPATQPAYLTTLGIEDWRREKQLLERELRAVLRDMEGL